MDEPGGPVFRLSVISQTDRDARVAFELIGHEEVAPETELWEFPPGSHVRCEMRNLGSRDVVVAVAFA